MIRDGKWMQQKRGRRAQIRNEGEFRCRSTQRTCSRCPWRK
jgi:hypothetical protein